MTFGSLPLMPVLAQGIVDAGFTYCTPIQAQTLPIALQGRDVAIAGINQAEQRHHQEGWTEQAQQSDQRPDRAAHLSPEHDREIHDIGAGQEIAERDRNPGDSVRPAKPSAGASGWAGGASSHQ